MKYLSKGHGVRLEKGKKRKEGCIKFILCLLIMFSEEKLKVCFLVSVMEAIEIYSRQFDCAWV